MTAEGPQDTPDSGNRWYDKDPVLSRAMAQLRDAPDKQQAQIALNIIKIIVEHQIEQDTELNVEDIACADAKKTAWPSDGRNRRWYDMHETLSSAIQLLRDCPDDLQTRLIPSIAGMIEQTLHDDEQTHSA